MIDSFAMAKNLTNACGLSAVVTGNERIRFVSSSSYIEIEVVLKHVSTKQLIVQNWNHGSSDVDDTWGRLYRPPIGLDVRRRHRLGRLHEASVPAELLRQLDTRPEKAAVVYRKDCGHCHRSDRSGIWSGVVVLLPEKAASDYSSASHGPTKFGSCDGWRAGLRLSWTATSRASYDDITGGTLSTAELLSKPGTALPAGRIVRR
ncbi:hypothetical protein V5799_032998 [Amblyomma americanum]|uniref:Uncharacterized protein n=1 Tax=Amblyomma americanum TaxID=6943 RepID=A0AAQ4DPK5_AMBAM